MRAKAPLAAAPGDDVRDTRASIRTESNSAPLALSEYTALRPPRSSLACATDDTSCGPEWRPIEPELNTSSVTVDEASNSPSALRSSVTNDDPVLESFGMPSRALRLATPAGSMTIERW